MLFVCDMWCETEASPGNGTRLSICEILYLRGMDYQPGVLLKLHDSLPSGEPKPYLFPSTLQKNDLFWKYFQEKNTVPTPNSKINNYVLWDEGCLPVEPGMVLVLIRYLRSDRGNYAYVLHDGRVWTTSVFSNHQAFRLVYQVMKL